MDNEIWKPVVGYEGLYEVSNLGNVRTCNRRVMYSDGRVFNYKSVVMKPTINRGYVYVNLLKEHKPYPKKVHRLVAESFIDNPLGKPCVDHINANKQDNRAENLRWVTHSENMKNEITAKAHKKAYENGLSERIVAIKKKKGIIRKVYQFNLDGTFIAEHESIADAARATNICMSSIYQRCAGKSSYSHAGGYLWSFDKTVEPYVNPQLKRYRKIDMYSAEGVYIKTFANRIEASRETGASKKGITRCCAGERKKHMGYQWKYNKDSYNYGKDCKERKKGRSTKSSS